MAERYKLTPEDSKVLSSVAAVLKRTKRFETYPTNRVVDENGCLEIIVAPKREANGCLGFLFPPYAASKRESRKVEFRKLLLDLYKNQRELSDRLRPSYGSFLGGIPVSEAYGFPVNGIKLIFGYTDEDPRARLAEQRLKR